MEKTSLKVEMMVQYIKENNQDYKIFPRKMLRSYLKDKFKCSTYMANQVIKKLFEDE